jgi:CD2 antigen cytoplasmic tail-binding protein 2
MKEELEEGHFDADGHYQWKKDKDIKDNWLDNIDWVKIKKDSNYKDKYNAAKGLADSSDSSDSDEDDDLLRAAASAKFDPLETYRSIFALMQKGETIKKSIKRIGGSNAKISTVERIRRKKAGIVDESASIVTRLTELSNEILTKSGNMDIYDETYEQIEARIQRADKKKEADAKIPDMYADDFEEKAKGDGASTSKQEVMEEEDEKTPALMWEYKVEQADTVVQGPFATEQMQKFVDEGQFKKEVFVRKVGAADERFYSSSRIDFELYL